MGTLICQYVAAQKPAAVTSLALFNPILAPAETARQRLADRAHMARHDGMAAVSDAVIEGGLSSATKNDNPIAVSFVRESHMRQDAEAFAQTCEALAQASAPDLRLVGAPMLLVTGDEDPVAPPGTAWTIADKVKRAKVRILDRCGHWGPIERPRECSRLLSEFIRSEQRE
jgi:pimeloyl-ACP methyl ester carboxylesterase